MYLRKIPGFPVSFKSKLRACSHLNCTLLILIVNKNITHVFLFYVIFVGNIAEFV